MTVDDRYRFGRWMETGQFDYLFEADCSEFYNLKTRAEKELTPSQLHYLFDPTMGIGGGRQWWNLERPNYTYKTDHYGFRSSPILSKMEDVTVNHWKKSYVCLGCSWTFGIGIPDYFTWPEIVRRYNGWDCLNLGVPAGGIGATYRLLNAWLEYFGAAPKGILISGWFTPRLEKYNTITKQYESSNLQTHGNTKKLVTEVKTNAVFKSYRKKFVELNEKWNLDIYRLNPNQVYNYGHQTTSTVAEEEYFKDREEFLKLKGLGYDMSHPSPTASIMIANLFRKVIETEDKFII